MTTEQALDALHKEEGGGIKTWPSGKVEVFRPAPGGSLRWSRKQVDIRSGETLSSAIRRALEIGT